MKKTKLLSTGIILDKKYILPLYGTMKRVLEVNCKQTHPLKE